MSYYSTIYQSLAADVESFFGGLGIPVLYAGVGSETPDDGQWIEFRFFNNDTMSATMANDDASIARGFARIGVCGKPRRGLVPLYDLADVSIEHFRKGFVIDAPTNSILYESPSVGGVVEEDDRIILPVTLRFQGTYVPA